MRFVAPLIALLVISVQLGSLQATVVNEPAFGMKWNPKNEGRVLIKDFARMGARITTLGAQWSVLQPDAGSWKFSRLDGWIREASAAGVEVVLKIIVCSGWFSGDASARQGRPAKGSSEEEDGRTCQSRMPRDLDEYARFVSEVVRHYKGQVRYFAIQNEVNAPHQWPGTLADYHRLLRVAYKAAKTANPDAIVVDAGMGSLTYGYVIARDVYERTGNAAEAAHFFNTYYAGRQGRIPQATAENFGSVVLRGRLADRYYDFLLGHFKERSYDAYQLHFYDDWRATDQVVTWIQEQMRRNDNIKPIVGWEMGYKWPPGKQYDPDEHATGLVRKYVVALGLGVRHMIYLPAFRELEPDEDRVPSWPLFDCGPSGCLPLKAARAFQLIATTLTGASPVRKLVLGDTQVWVFTRADRKIIVGWSGRPKSVDLSTQGRLLRAYDMYGEAVTVIDLTQVPMTERPLFLEMR